LLFAKIKNETGFSLAHISQVPGIIFYDCG
jgi:hypothetical protein